VDSKLVALQALSTLFAAICVCLEDIVRQSGVYSEGHLRAKF